MMDNKIKKIVSCSLLLIIIVCYLNAQITPDCSFITDNSSGQITTGKCAPVTLTMEVEYRFMFPVDSDLVQVLYVWNDGTGASDTIIPNNQGDTIFTAVQSHLYLPADECSYTAEAFIIANGVQCTSSSIQEQTFSAWSTDNLNSGVLNIAPPEVQICEGDDVDTIFSDQSTFNCNMGIEPDLPNRLIRWVQFVYNSDTNSLTLIPNASVVDPLGNVYPLTDATGNSLNMQYGPIITVPFPADGPNQDSWRIIAPPGGVAGDYIEITMRNWNFCNAYDNDPYDGLDPADTLNGHNPPIETTAYVRIITTPPAPATSSVDVCVNENIILNAGPGTLIRWYSDSLLTTLLSTGPNFYPLLPPVNLDNSIPGNYSFYATDAIGFCESAPDSVGLNIYDDPTTANAGTDQYICIDTSVLQGNTPVTGTGEWTTTSSAVFNDPFDPNTPISNLDVGINEFTWTITNGPCTSSDQIIIYRDLQPGSADAGVDSSFCNISNIQLYANTPTNGGLGNWSFVQGGGNISDTTLPDAIVSNLNQGINILTWTIESANGGCNSSTDSIEITRDIMPDSANAGTDDYLCETDNIYLSGNSVTSNGTGTWTIITGTATITDLNDPLSNVTNLSYGLNSFEWNIESELGICEPTMDTVDIIRYEMPLPSDAGPDQLLCNVLLSDTLQANIPSVGNGIWQIISSPSGSSPAFNPNNTANNAVLEISSGDEGVYILTWNIINGTCETHDTVIIDFGLTLPPADAGPDTALCGLTHILNADPPPVGTGTWSMVSGSGTPDFSNINDPNATVSISGTESGIYLLEWRTFSGSCASLPIHRDTVEIYFKPMPEPPVTSNVENCGPGQVELSVNKSLNATTSRWYDSITGGSLIQSDTVFLTPVLTISKRYYVSAYNDTSLCESSRQPIDAIIYPIPDLPISSDVQHCGKDSIVLNAFIGANGLSNRWYENETDIIPVAPGSQFTTPILSNSRSYWVTSYHDSTTCESNKLEVQITIDSVPYLPITSDTNRCGPGSFVLGAITGLYGTTNRWYTQASGGILLATSDTYITNYLTTTTTFHVSSYNDTTACESERESLTVYIDSIPDRPFVIDTSICGYDSLSLSAIPGDNGTTIRWYNMPGGTTIIYTGDTFQTPYLTSSVSYWLSTYNELSGCESFREQMDVEIKELPQTTPIQGYEFVRLNQINVVYSVDYHTGSTYNWVIPPEITKINEVDNFVILGFPSIGSHTISVLETAANGCPGEVKEKEIVVTNEVITIVIDDRNVETCHYVNLPLNIIPQGGNAPYFYNWTGDSAYLSDKSVANPIFLATKSGIYNLNVHVWDIDDNHAYDTMKITVNNNPVVTFSPDEDYVCAGSDYQIIPGITGGTGSYPVIIWTGNTVGLSSLTSATPVFNTNVENSYQMILTIRDTKSCSGQDTIILNNVLPEASFTTDAVPSCSPVTFSFTNTSKDASIYTWDFGDGNTSTDTSTTHTYYNLTTSIQYYNTQLTAIDEHDCESTATSFITIYPNPDHSFTVSPQKDCDPLRVILTSTPGGFNYKWNFGDGSHENSNYSTYHEFSNNGTEPKDFNISLIATSFFNCVDTFYNYVTVFPSPKPDFTASPESQMYPEATISFSDIPTGDYEYIWNFGDDKTSAEENPEAHEYLYPGNYEISLKMIGEYCSDSISKRITILPHPPQAKFKKVEPGCMPHGVQFENQSTYADSYFWEFGDGAFSNEPDPFHTYYDAGVYKIKLTASNKKEGLKSVSNDMSTVYILPNAFFDLAPKIVFVNDEQVHFFNLSDNGDTYEWDFGDGSELSTDFEPQHLYKSEGKYDVTLRVITNDGCYDLYEMKEAVLVEESGKIVFPNVIKPLSHIDQNQVFRPAILDEVDTYHLMIFNRWGELIFETKNPDEGWNGYYNGGPVKSDVYVWKLKGKYINGRPIDETGDVTVMY